MSQQYTPQQVETIRQTVAKGASDAQLALFLEVCKSKGLDPFSKQVYFTPQGIIVSIDGLRTIAERTGCYAPGPTRYEYGPEGQLIAAYVTVRKLVANTWHDVEESAFLDEYRGSSPIWRKMPRVMLAKCSESRALRRAFAADLSGLYSAEEMDQARDREVITPATPATPATPEISDEYLDMLEAIGAAETADDLKMVSAKIRQLTLSAAQMDALRKAYATKRAEVA